MMSVDLPTVNVMRVGHVHYLQLEESDKLWLIITSAYLDY